MSLTVIGICGHNESGKDTVASILASVGGFHRIGLADAVRASLDDLGGITWDLRKEDDWLADADRQSMKVIGTECREDIGDTLHWANNALIKIRYLNHYVARPRTRFIIPDIRFPHEPPRLKEMIESWGGEYLTWKVTRPGKGVKTGHASETSVDKIPFDLEIRNNRTKWKLKEQAIELATRFGEEAQVA